MQTDLFEFEKELLFMKKWNILHGWLEDYYRTFAR